MPHMRNALALCVTFVFVAASSLAFGAPVQDRQTADSRSFFTFTGIVLAVDPESNELTLEEASAEAEKTTFILDTEAKLEKNGRAIELSEIATGDPVSVEYDVRPSGQKVVQKLELITKPTTF